jgi:prophage regulatory protein
MDVNSFSKPLLLRQRDVCRLLQVSRSTLFRWERAGAFPARLRVGPGIVAWRKSDIDDWLRSRPAAAGTATPPVSAG